MRSSIFFFLFFLAFTLFLTGCWDRQEPEMLGLVITVGFDLEEETGNLRVTAEIANPLGIGGGEDGGAEADRKPFYVVSASGHTAYEAVENLELRSTKDLHWSHLNAVIISESLAREGIRPVLDWLDREPQTRLIVYPFIAEGNVQKLLEGEYHLEQLGGIGLAGQLVTSAAERGTVPETTMLLVFHHLSLPGMELLLPRIKVMDQDEEIGDDPGAVIPSKLDGAAFFQKDKLAGFGEEREIRGYQWMVPGKMERALLVIQCPGEEKRLVSIVIHETRTEVIPRVEEGAVRLEMLVQAKGRIHDFGCGEFPPGDTEYVRSLERRLAHVIRNDIEQSLALAQELNTDVFGFGNAIYRKHPREWELLEKRWSEIFPDLVLTLDVEAEIRRTGVVFEPIRIR